MAAADTIKDFPLAEVKRCGDCGARFGREATFCPFCGVPLSAGTWDRALDPLVGKIIDNRYEVLEPLGEGGMGTVYKVRHVTLNRHFAMKALRRDLATDAALSQRFIQEARATAAIKHPSVVSINDFGVLEDGIPYFVMELLVGQTLSLRMRAGGPLPPREAIAIAKRIADGLSASHAANVIHRDLKPENVFLVGANEVRIVDFGAAKIVGGSKLTRPGVVFGTPYYMSPEQAGGQPVDGRADIYSLGVLLFEMITGRVPFEADTYMGVLTKHMFAQPPKPSEAVGAGVQLGALEGVVLRALEKEPTARYASMDELKRALEDADRNRISNAPVGRTQPLGQMPLGTVRLSTAERIERSVEKQLAREQLRKRKQLTTIAVTMVMTTVVGLGLIALYMRSRSSPEVIASPEPPPPSPPPSATFVPPNESATVGSPTPTTTPTTTTTTTTTAATTPAPSPSPSMTTAAAKTPSVRWTAPAKPSGAPKSADAPPPPTAPPTQPKPAHPTSPSDFHDPWQQ